MILPLPWRMRYGAAALQPWKTPERLTPRIACQSSRLASATGATLAMPELLITMSSRPSAVTVSLISRSTAAYSATSVGSTSARTPWASAWCAVSSSSGLARAARATSAPASASATAIARPSPRLAPVTTATLPSSGLAVEALQLFLVLLGDDLALDLQRGRELAALRREVHRQDRELLDLGVRLQIGVLLLHRARDALVKHPKIV